MFMTLFRNDLRPLMHTDYRSKSKDGIEYSFQVCGSVSDGSCSNDAGEFCCKWNLPKEKNQDTRKMKIFFLPGACIVHNKTSTGLTNSNLLWRQGGPYLNYTNGADCGKGQRRYTLIGFFCGAERSISGPTIMENDDCALIIHWNTPLVCAKQVKHSSHLPI